VNSCVSAADGWTVDMPFHTHKLCASTMHERHQLDVQCLLHGESVTVLHRHYAWDEYSKQQE
jgi:hypothetical protein